MVISEILLFGVVGLLVLVVGGFFIVYLLVEFLPELWEALPGVLLCAAAVGVIGGIVWLAIHG
jgi:hypothetical protein